MEPARPAYTCTSKQQALTCSGIHVCTLHLSLLSLVFKMPFSATYVHNKYLSPAHACINRHGNLQLICDAKPLKKHPPWIVVSGDRLQSHEIRVLVGLAEGEANYDESRSLRTLTGSLAMGHTLVHTLSCALRLHSCAITFLRF